MSWGLYLYLYEHIKGGYRSWTGQERLGAVWNLLSAAQAGAVVRGGRGGVRVEGGGGCSWAGQQGCVCLRVQVVLPYCGNAGKPKAPTCTALHHNCVADIRCAMRHPATPLTPCFPPLPAVPSFPQVCLMTNPIWLIKTRLALQQGTAAAAAAGAAGAAVGSSSAARAAAAAAAVPYKGLMDAFVRIGREEGLKGYYKGLGPSLLLVRGLQGKGEQSSRNDEFIQFLVEVPPLWVTLQPRLCEVLTPSLQQPICFDTNLPLRLPLPFHPLPPTPIPTRTWSCSKRHTCFIQQSPPPRLWFLLHPPPSFGPVANHPRRHPVCRL